MKVLYIGRLFSGLESSLKSQYWQPTGAPTIFKVIEKLDTSPHEVRIVLTCKDGTSTWQEKRDKTLSIQGLRTPVHVLSGAKAISMLFGPIRHHLSELRHLLEICRTVRAFKPDIIYLGNANIWSGGFLSRMCAIPVVYRMMGVYPAMRNALSVLRPANLLLRWCYRAPYAAAICTQDGSGIEQWLNTALNRNVKKYLWINGVDIPETPNEMPFPIDNLPDNRTIVLFIGHLESAKGCGVFLEAFLKVISKRPGSVHALMIGTGSMQPELIGMARDAGQSESVTFIDRLPHDKVVSVHHRADIYVSLNKLGNLSNANLEAMRLGQCIIIPRAQPSVGIDTITEQLVPKDAVTWINHAEDTESLVNAVLKLHDSPAIRKKQGHTMSIAAEKFIPTWDHRLDSEITLLEHIVEGTPFTSNTSSDD